VPWKLKRRLEDNTKTDPKVITFKDVDCIHLDQDRVQWLLLANMIIDLRIS
jgi:hypothetical protein